MSGNALQHIFDIVPENSEDNGIRALIDAIVNGKALMILLLKDKIISEYSSRAFDYVDLRTEEVISAYLVANGKVFACPPYVYETLAGRIKFAGMPINVQLYERIDNGYPGEYISDTKNPRDAELVWIEAMYRLCISPELKREIINTVGNKFGLATKMRISGIYGPARYFVPELRRDYAQLKALEEKLNKQDTIYKNQAMKNIQDNIPCI